MSTKAEEFIFTNHFDEQEELVHTSRSRWNTGISITKTLIKRAFEVLSTTLEFVKAVESQ